MICLEQYHIIMDLQNPHRWMILIFIKSNPQIIYQPTNTVNDRNGLMRYNWLDQLHVGIIFILCYDLIHSLMVALTDIPITSLNQSIIGLIKYLILFSFTDSWNFSSEDPLLENITIISLTSSLTTNTSNNQTLTFLLLTFLDLNSFFFPNVLVFYEQW